MEYKEEFSPYRILSFLGMSGLTFGVTLIQALINHLYLDEILCIALIDCVFLSIIVYQLAEERKLGNLGGHIYTNFQRVLIGYGICQGLSLVGTFAPEFLKPICLIPVVMFCYSNQVIATSVSLYLCMILGLVSSGGAIETMAYLFEIFFVVALMKALAYKENIFWVALALGTGNIFLPVIFCYWSYKRVTIGTYIWALIEGLVLFLFVLLLGKRIKKNTAEELQFIFSDIIQDDYPLVLEVKAYSKQEYNHCQKVSVLCYRIAGRLGFNQDLCAAAGFYYRMGRWYGQPYTENGVKMAQKYCFPTPVIDILWEYDGEKKKPSTPESALIHMVDHLLIKLELFKQEVGDSMWNKDMIVYQALNELTNTDFYDESGLSMHQFLQIREYLVKEEHLI